MENEIPWLNKSIQTKKIPEKKHKHAIIHEIFEQAMAYTNDKFWKDHLLKAARNKLPKKIFIRDNYIIYNGYKNDKMLLTKNPEETCNVFIEFLRKNIGLLSTEDKKTNSNIVFTPVVWSDWKSISKKQKTLLLEAYIQYLIEYNTLSTVESLQLRKIIWIYVSRGDFDTTNIIIGDGCITSIEGLLYDNIKRIFYTNI